MAGSPGLHVSQPKPRPKPRPKVTELLMELHHVNSGEHSVPRLRDGALPVIFFVFPKAPNTSLEGALGWFLEVKPLLKRYLDP